MIPSLRKDLPWIFVAGLPWIAALAIALVAEGFAFLWVIPPTELHSVFGVGWIAGAMLGLCVGTLDEFRRTREPLARRACSPRAVHAARVLGCAFVLVLWGTVPPLIAWNQEVGHGVDAGLGQPAHLTYVWLALAPAATATAIGLTAAALPAHLLLRLAVGAAALFLTFTLVTGWTEASNPESYVELRRSRHAFGWLHMGSTALFVLASFTLQGARRDPDRPWSRGSRRVGIGASIVVLALGASIVLGALEARQGRSLSREYPIVAVRKDGRCTLRKLLPDGRKCVSVDAYHRTVDDDGDTSWYFSAAPTSLWPRSRGFRAPIFHRRTLGAQFLDDGRLLAWTRPDRFGSLLVLTAGKGAQHLPFSPQARCHPGALQGTALDVWVHEPSSGELWRLDEAAGHFVAALLPDGDRFERIVRRGDWNGGGVRGLRAASALFIGTTGLFVWRDGRFEQLPETERERLLLAQPYPASEARFTAVSSPDALSPHVRILDASGATIFEHQYEPRTPSERSAAFRLLAFSACRPPLLAVAAHTLGGADPVQHVLLDPLVAGGRRLWQVAIVVAVGALGAGLALLRLRRWGVDRFTLWFWALLALALGPAAVVLCSIFERRRAWSRGPASETTSVPRIV